MLSLSLIGCDSINDMTGMFEKQELAQSIMKDRYGLDSQLGFNINNGQLTQVTLVLDANDIREKTVTELEEMTMNVVSEVFKSEPHVIYIQIASSQHNES